MVQKAMDASNALLELFQFTKLGGPKEAFDYADQLKEADKFKDALLADGEDPCAGILADCLKRRVTLFLLSLFRTLQQQTVENFLLMYCLLRYGSLLVGKHCVLKRFPSTLWFVFPGIPAFIAPLLGFPLLLHGIRKIALPG